MVEATTERALRPIIEAPFKTAEEILAGDFQFGGRVTVVFDLNENLSPDERDYGFSWIRERLGASVDEALVRNEYVSSRMNLQMVVFAKEIGEGWYLARWQSLGRQPLYFQPIYFLVRGDILDDEEKDNFGMPILEEY